MKSHQKELNQVERVCSMERKGNVISMHKLNHQKCVTEFLKCIHGCVKAGYQEIHLVDEATTFFPNALVPIAGIIDYYIRVKNIDFIYDFDPDSYLAKCNFSNPIDGKNEMDFQIASRYPLDKVFKFSTGKQVAELSQAYVDLISQLAVCQDGVLDSLSWCINEVMDNVLTHSEANEGFVMAQHHPQANRIALCVYDSGIGVYKTLSTSKHAPRTEIDALTLAIQEGVGDGKGQGNGLFGLYKTVLSNKGRFALTSGNASIMINNDGKMDKYECLPFISYEAKSTTVDFQLSLSRKIDIKSFFTSIGGEDWKVYDPRIDEMLSNEDEFIHYDVYEHSTGTGTRDAGKKLKNDIKNILTREKRIIVLDFSHVQTVSSSFIDEFIAKLVLDLGFVCFNQLIRITGMNDTIRQLCERSLYMRINEEWNSRISPECET